MKQFSSSFVWCDRESGKKHEKKKVFHWECRTCTRQKSNWMHVNKNAFWVNRKNWNFKIGFYPDINKLRWSFVFDFERKSEREIWKSFFLFGRISIFRLWILNECLYAVQMYNFDIFLFSLLSICRACIFRFIFFIQIHKHKYGNVLLRIVFSSFFLLFFLLPGALMLVAFIRRTEMFAEDSIGFSFFGCSGVSNAQSKQNKQLMP